MIKILLAEDTQDLNRALTALLQHEGYDVDPVFDGEEALEKAEQFAPDVVLTDIQMPFMDGLTFCKKLKELMPQVRIIIFSGYDEKVVIEKRYSLEENSSDESEK